MTTLTTDQRVTYSPAFLARRAPELCRYARHEQGTVLFVYRGTATVLWDNGTRADLDEDDLEPVV